MRLMVLLVMLASGCANVHVNRATLLASTAALAIDWSYTRGAAVNDWHCGGSDLKEVGSARVFLGGRPDAGAIDSYFGIAAISNIMIWMIMPKRYRSALPIGLVAFQAKAIAFNAGGRVAECM